MRSSHYVFLPNLLTKLSFSSAIIRLISSSSRTDKFNVCSITVPIAGLTALIAPVATLPAVPPNTSPITCPATVKVPDINFCNQLGNAFQIALANFVKPEGRIFSYEIREDFFNEAIKNFEKTGVIDYVDLKNNDITQKIFEKNMDTIVLDMATPWLVVSQAHLALRGSGLFISFSPTIDQVVKTCESLKENGFVNIQTIESFIRGIRVERGKTRPDTLMTAHTGYITSATKANK